MSKVTGSKPYQTRVIHDRPGQRQQLLVAGVLLLLVAIALAYWLGGRSVQADKQSLQALQALTQQQLQEAEASYQDVAQQLANIKLGSEVDRQAVEEVRAVVREHKQTIAELSEEIAFYKGLMAPTDKERGLGIRSWEVYPTADPDRFQFKLVMQQLAVKHALLVGSVVVELVGKQYGVEQTFPLSIISQQVQDKSVRLRFKYFQTIDGELQLPEGFSVERVDVVAKASKPKAVTVEKHYSWLVQNSGV